MCGPLHILIASSEIQNDIILLIGGFILITTFLECE